jgi:AraC-like DNA-binding protein
MLVARCGGPDILRRGVTASVAADMGVSLRCVQRTWEEGYTGGGVNAVVSKRAKHCGRKRIEINPDDISAIPLKKRTTLQDLAAELNVSKSTLHRRFKEGKFKRHTNDIKPILTDDNMKARVRYCLDMLDPTSLPQEPTFRGMFNVVHIDEKWFYLTRRCQKFYLSPNEERPKRGIRNKAFIPKVMFLTAISRPRFDQHGTCMFDGKIGMFAFVTKEYAKRNSRYRDRGTLITKAMTSVKKADSREYLVNMVLPAIKQKWPAEDFGQPIFIQQYNTKTHIDVNDAVFKQAATADGFDIRLMCQPPNSLDLNIFDLAFFAGIQAMFQKSSPKNIDDIIAKVNEAFQQYPEERSNRIFLTHQTCMMQIMKEKGSHHYSIPHMKKQALEKNGVLPERLQCDLNLIEEAREFVNV